MPHYSKFIATPFDLHGGYIIERWNDSRHQYERFAPIDGVLPEKFAIETAAFMNSLSEE